MRARHAHVEIGGRRDGSLLVVMDVEPLISESNDPDALYGATDLHLLGVAHRTCVDEARRRLIAGEVLLPDELPQLRVDDQVPELPVLHLPPAPGRCPFCDGADPSEEHVFPQWVSRELTAIGGLVDRSGEYGPRRLAKLQSTAPICRACNNRWLSVLENDTKPILAPMIRGVPQRLFHVEQKLLSTWALKTAMMMDLASGAPVIPTGFFHELRQRRAPFRSSFVWIAGYRGSWAVWASHSGLHLGIPESERPNGFVTTFALCRMVFQVVAHFTRGEAEFKDDRIFNDALAQISPMWCMPIEWPPNRTVFNDEWLLKLSESIA